MNYHTIAVLHRNDPAITALRKEWLPLAVGFLHYAFKRKHEVLLPQETFCEQLDLYLEHVNAGLPAEAQYRHRYDFYLDRWSGEDDLVRVRSLDEGYVVQLSPHAERILDWFEAMQSRSMIGTESRLRTILTLLDEVIIQSTEDVEARLRQLHDKREQIEAEIARIEATQQVEGLTNVQIRERLDQISTMATQLLRDFSLVEDRFREMARTIQQAQLNPKTRRGEILGTALEADEQLEASDEGQSFRAFYQLLTHPEQRDRFDALINTVFEMPRLATFVGDNTILQRLTSHLLDAGERVNRSNRRLAEHLRRVVDTRNITESRRVQMLSGEIKHLVSQIQPDARKPLLSSRRQFFSLEGEPDIDLPLARPLFDPPPKLTAIEPPRPASTQLDVDTLATLYDTFFIDQRVLQANIKRLLMSRPEVTLAELVESYPVTQGIAEVIAYVLIAAREPQHTVDRTASQIIVIQTPGSAGPKSIAAPKVVFRQPRRGVEVNGA